MILRIAVRIQMPGVETSFPLVQNVYRKPFPNKNIYGNGVPTRSRTTTPLIAGHALWYVDCSGYSNISSHGIEQCPA